MREGSILDVSPVFVESYLSQGLFTSSLLLVGHLFFIYDPQLSGVRDPPYFIQPDLI